MNTKRTLPLILTLFVSIDARASILAFPGAQGFGRFATGGRGGEVYHVTNLADTGKGSLRDAVGKPGRTVVFDMSGYIAIKSQIVVASNITVAGQTAPGQGIGVMGQGFSLEGAHNVVVRHLRLRSGDMATNFFHANSLGMHNADSVMIDHVSIEFGGWNDIDAVNGNHITLSDCIVAAPIGQGFGAHFDHDSVTFLRNIFANSHSRNAMSRGSCQFINNLLYDYQGGFNANGTGTQHHDVIGNVFVAGPITGQPMDRYFQCQGDSAFARDNLLDRNKDGIFNPVADSARPTADFLGLMTSPWASTSLSMASLAAKDVLKFTTSHAGASLHRDQVDSLVVSDVLSLGKLGKSYAAGDSLRGIGNQLLTGLANFGYGLIAPGRDSTDSDQDGIPDWWERKHGLDPHDPADAKGTSLSVDGYTNLEMYLDELAGDPVVFRTTTDLDRRSPIHVLSRNAGILRVLLEDACDFDVDLVEPRGRRIGRFGFGRLGPGEHELGLNLDDAHGRILFLRTSQGTLRLPPSALLEQVRR